MRGNRDYAGCNQGQKRSIPACAGKPLQVREIGGVGGVYPRVCGETLALIPEIPLAIGLSPRVRGNHISSMVHDEGNGSIPACAGKPPPIHI